MKKLYVDDVRCPAGYRFMSLNGVPEYIEHLNVIATTFHEAIYLLEQFHWDEVSLDHDLGAGSIYGYREMSGYDILQWLIDRKQRRYRVPNIVKVHSANPEGVRKMKEDIKRYWPESE